MKRTIDDCIARWKADTYKTDNFKEKKMEEEVAKLGKLVKKALDDKEDVHAVLDEIAWAINDNETDILEEVYHACYNADIYPDVL